MAEREGSTASALLSETGHAWLRGEKRWLENEWADASNDLKRLKEAGEGNCDGVLGPAHPIRSEQSQQLSGPKGETAHPLLAGLPIIRWGVLGLLDA